MSDAMQLHEHGTRAFRLPAGAIVSTAEHDLDSREYNKRYAAGQEIGPTRRYAFLAKHVRRAKTAAELIALAIKENGAAKNTTKINTKRIYGDLATLRAALDRVTPKAAA